MLEGWLSMAQVGPLRECSCMPQQAVWRWLLEEFSQLVPVSVFIEASQNFIFGFLRNKAAKNFKNCRRIYKEYLVIWFF